MTIQVRLIAGIFCAVLLAGAAYSQASSSSNPATVVADDTVRFPANSWSPALLRLIEEGPTILSRDFDVGIAAPPANTSLETRAELQLLLDMQKDERTPQQTKKIVLEHNLATPMASFEVANLYKASYTPETEKLMMMINHEMGYFLMREKQKYQRARPSQLEPKLTTMFPNPPHAAYPSGHAGQAYAVALVLAEINPGFKGVYVKHAIAVGHRREIAGVHYPSDSEAGRMIAEKVVKAVLAQPDIQPLFEKAKQEFVTP